MKITIKQLSKRFNREWILSNISLKLESGQSYAILGPNGSGKSTLIQLISGSISPSKGSIEYSENNTLILVDDIYKHISYAAPYLQLIEEFTLEEQLDFHQKFKPFVNNYSNADILEIIQLGSHKTKPIGEFSSGMKQRVKLGLALLSDVAITLLDEPLTNLDKVAAVWYNKLVEQHATNRILLVASNREDEYLFCQEHINILQYK